MTFTQLIEKVLKETNTPMSGTEIWRKAEEKGYDKLLNSKGKNPKNTLTSILYTDIKKVNSKYVLHSSNPKKFTLK